MQMRGQDTRDSLGFPAVVAQSGFSAEPRGFGGYSWNQHVKVNNAFG